MMRKCGQRGGLTVRLEGFLRHPPPWSRGGPLFRHPIARGGGATAHPLPGARVSTSERPGTGAVVSVRWKWRLQSGRALSSPGPLPPPSAMEAPEVLWQRRGETGGDSFVASTGHLVNQISAIAAAGGPADGAAGARPLCVTLTATGAGGSVDGAPGACPLCATGWVTAREAPRMAPQVPVPPCHFLPPAPGLVDVT